MRSGRRPHTTQESSRRMSQSPTTAGASQTRPATAAAGKPGLRRQFVSFYGLKVSPAWRALPDAEKARGREGFIAACEAFKAEGGILVPYSLVGVRGDVDV